MQGLLPPEMAAAFPLAPSTQSNNRKLTRKEQEEDLVYWKTRCQSTERHGCCGSGSSSSCAMARRMETPTIQRSNGECLPPLLCLKI